MESIQFVDLNTDSIREIVAKLYPYDRVSLASSTKTFWEELHTSVIPTTFDGLCSTAFYAKMIELESMYIDLMDTINDIIQPLLMQWHRRGIFMIECGHSQLRVPSMGNTGDVCNLTYSSSSSVYPFVIRYQVRHDIEIVYNATSQEFEDHVDLYSHVYTNLLHISVPKIKAAIKAKVSEFSTIWNAVVEFANWMQSEIIDMITFLRTRYPGHVYSIAWDFLSWKGSAGGPFLLHVNGFHSSRYLLSVHRPSETPLLFGRDTSDILWSVYARETENEIVVHDHVAEEDQKLVLGMIVRFKELRGKKYQVFDAERKIAAAERGVICIADKRMPSDEEEQRFRDIETKEISWWVCSPGSVHIA